MHLTDFSSRFLERNKKRERVEDEDFHVLAMARGELRSWEDEAKRKTGKRRHNGKRNFTLNPIRESERRYSFSITT